MPLITLLAMSLITLMPIYVRIYRQRVYIIENNLIKCLNNCKDILCGIAGHRHCTVSISSHTSCGESSLLALNHSTEFFRLPFIFIYSLSFLLPLLFI